MKVCEKVKKKGTTSYNEVADELVGEFTNPAHMNSLTDQVFISSNIFIFYRRKIYILNLICHTFFSNMIRKISEDAYTTL